MPVFDPQWPVVTMSLSCLGVLADPRPGVGTVLTGMKRRLPCRRRRQAIQRVRIDLAQ